MILNDNAGGQRTVKVEAVADGNGFLEIRANGYGEYGAESGFGAVACLELLNGRLRLLVFADINKESATHIIDLEGAREEART